MVANPRAARYPLERQIEADPELRRLASAQYAGTTDVLEIAGVRRRLFAAPDAPENCRGIDSK